MQLSINGWPPIASHTACIIIGMILSTGSYTSKNQPKVFSESHLNIAIPTANIIYKGKGEKMIRTLNSYEKCFDEFKLVHTIANSTFLSIPIKGNEMAIKSLFKGDKKRINHMFNSKGLHHCVSGPKVRYE